MTDEKRILEFVASAIDRSVVVIHYEFRGMSCSQHIIDPGKFQDALREAARSAGGGESISGQATMVGHFTAAPPPAATTAAQSFMCCDACEVREACFRFSHCARETPGPAQPGRESEKGKRNADDMGTIQPGPSHDAVRTAHVVETTGDHAVREDADQRAAAGVGTRCPACGANEAEPHRAPCVDSPTLPDAAQGKARCRDCADHDGTCPIDGQPCDPTPSAPPVQGEGRLTIADFVTAQREWSERTFGPGPRAKGNVDHIRKELAEIEANPSDLVEWCDVATLALDGAWREGHEPEAIAAALFAKLEKNKRRQWPDWRTSDPDKGIQHIKSTPAVPESGLREAALAYVGDTGGPLQSKNSERYNAFLAGAAWNTRAPSSAQGVTTVGDAELAVIDRLNAQARDNTLRAYATGMDGEKFIYRAWADSDAKIVAALTRLQSTGGAK